MALPTSDAPLSAADRLSLRLGLWLLLRAQRPKRSAVRHRRRVPRPAASDPLQRLSRDNAQTLTSYGLLRQLR
ncbi:hypothetical protein [Microbacterium sp. NIBRBAC000506063]|uniref:hypothetical protein n=1 Tax=Microbacterium sp. NIBRBAC000506063 TaxID=2734618 RepID=UPI001BB5A353|nr:hypothetical protein [Microbacterium sp. NIBRBAC000506063]QTV79649.1 hypothetical protein KAE78_12660 [Microbacterium sp. NIBRBAC000506063]